MTLLSDAVVPPHYQRRIGRRYPIRVGLEWTPVAHHRRRRRDRTFLVMTENVSVTGIAFESTTRQGVVCGAPVRISLRGKACTATVRAARPGSTPGSTVYAVEVRDTEMLDTMQSLITTYRRTHDDAAAHSVD